MVNQLNKQNLEKEASLISTIDNFFNKAHLIEKNIKYNVPIHLAFVNSQKTFDIFILFVRFFIFNIIYLTVNFFDTSLYIIFYDILDLLHFAHIL